MEKVSISNILILSQKYKAGLSSSSFKIDPAIKGEVTLSPDHVQLLALRDPTGSIPCICPKFSINILGNVIKATRWHLTSVYNAARLDLPTFYLEIDEFEVREVAVTPVLNESPYEHGHSISSEPDSDTATLSGRLLHLYPVYKLNVYAYLLLFQIKDERVYVLFTGDDLLSLHSLLKPDQEYRITNTTKVERNVKMFLSTQRTNVILLPSDEITPAATQLHDNHSTLEGVVTGFVEMESGHFILDNSVHLFICHMPAFLPIWGLKVGAKIRVSEFRLCTTGSNESLTQYAWCCHHTRIEVLSLSGDSILFFPYLPRMLSSLLLYPSLIPSSVLHLTLILEKLKQSFGIFRGMIHHLIELFNLKYLSPSDPVTELKMTLFAKECNIIPFTELYLPTTFTITELTEWLSLSLSHDEFIEELNHTKFDFTSHPSWDRIKHSSTLVDDMMKGTLIGRIVLCPDTGHVVLTDMATKLPIHFSSGIFPDQLVKLEDSIVAIKDYDLVVERSAFPNQISKLTHAYICTKYKDLFTILPHTNSPDKSGLYLILVMSKSPLKMDLTPGKKVEFKFIVYTKIYINCITSYSQCDNDPTHTLIGELPLVFHSDEVKWWRMVEPGWLYYWSGYDTSQMTPYIISRGNIMTFKPGWSLHPIGQLPARPLLAPEYDSISLLHKVKEGECKTCVIMGKILSIGFFPNCFLKAQFAHKNEEWVVVNIRNFNKPIRLSDLEKHSFPLLPLFYSLRLHLTFPVTDSLYLPIYINLPLCRMPIGLEVGSWVKLTGVKIKYQNSLPRGNIDNRGSIEIMAHPPSSQLPPSIYGKIKNISPANFRTFQTLSLRVAKSLTQEETVDQPSQTASPAKGMYSNRFAFCKEQRVTELEKRRMQKFSILLKYHKVLRLNLHIDKMISLTVQKSCYCCKQQARTFSSCPRATFRITSNLFACINNETIIVKTTNLCTKQLTNITESQMDELIRLLEDGSVIEIDKSYFDMQHSSPQWLYNLFFNFKTYELDAIVTYSISTDETKTPGKYPFQLHLYHFKFI